MNLPHIINFKNKAQKILQISCGIRQSFFLSEKREILYCGVETGFNANLKKNKKEDFDNISDNENLIFTSTPKFFDYKNKVN